MRTITRAALFAAALPATIAAQGVTTQSTVDVRLHGALGAVASFAARIGGGSMHDVPTTTYLSGHKMRTDNGNTAAIIDVDAGRMISIDNTQKTYTSMTFDEMAAMMREVQRKAEASRSEQAQRAPAKDPDAPKGDVKLNYKVAVDRPGQREKVAGANAERMFVTITLEAEATPEGGKTEQVGDFVVLMDQWISTDAPQIAAYKEFSQAYAKKAGQAFHEQRQALQSIFASDPRVKEGFEAAAKEMQKLQGIPLRSTTYMIVVPAGVTFDRKLALDEPAPAQTAAAPEPKKSGGLRGFMNKVKSAAEEASKKSDEPQGPPKQSTLMTMTDEVKSISTGPIPAETFAPPAGYREVKPRSVGGE
jgi:hypothetical protein